MDREILGPALTKGEDYRLVEGLREAVGKAGHPANLHDEAEVKRQAQQSRNAADRILRKFHIPLAHRNLLWGD